MTTRLLTKSEKKFPVENQTLDMNFQPIGDVEMQKLLGEDYPAGYVAGWASTPAIDQVRDSVPSSAFVKSISARGLTGPQGIKFLIGHDRDRPAGVIKKLEVKTEGLWIEAQLNLSISYVKDFYEAAKINEGFSFSIGYKLIDFEEAHDPEGNTYWILKEVDLKEVSAVPFPCNTGAIMTFIKTEEQPAPIKADSIAEFEKALVAAGLVEGRNAAHRITRAVKANPVLFQPKESPPVLAAQKLDKVSGLLDQLKSTLSSTN